MSRLVVAAALAAALVLATGAGAAPLALSVPNPGFESAVCASLPCPNSWGSTGTATAARDTSQFHTGAASLLLDSTVFGGAASARSDCFTGGVAANTTYYFSYWYRTTDTKVDKMEARLEFWQDTCMNATVTQDVTVTPIRDGAWHFVQGPAVMTNAATNHANVQLGILCVFGQTDCDGNYDDIVVDTVPTVVRVASLAARRTTAGVDLTWRTPSTVDTLGFNVWRSGARGAQYSKLNRSLVLGRGAAYRYRDRTALPGRGYVYKLQLVRPDGSRIWAASVRVGATRS